MLVGIVVITLAAALVWRVVAQREAKRYLSQYLFFIRFPVMLGAVMVLLPILGPSLAPDSLTNLFVLHWLQIAVVVFFACLLAWSVVYTARLIWVSTPVRSKLFPIRVDHAALDRELHAYQVPDELIPTRLLPKKWCEAWFLGSLALVVPLVVRLLAADAGRTRWLALLGVAIGVAVAGAVRWVSAKLGPRLSAIGRHGKAAEASAGEEASRIGFGLDGLYANDVRCLGEEPRAAYRRLHRRALIFALTALAVYLAFGATGPFFPLVHVQVAALTYLLSLLLVLVWSLSFVSFLCDPHRIPAVPFLVVLLVAWQAVFPRAHTYAVQEWEGPPPVSTRAALDTWAARERPFAVVAASGGGIAASLWTTYVLRGLGAHIEGFDRRVALVSAVSGGAVGSMFYVDAFGPHATPHERGLDSAVVARAASTSLGAAVWGLVYPDLWGLLAGSWLGTFDRGWAQELRWGHHLDTLDRTLGDWAAGVAQGWRPLAIFNVTLQETGERLLLAPAEIPVADGDLRWDLFELLPGRDVRVVTAARLSATFPYVSPQARPALGGALADSAAYHGADGGYYDNSGMLSAVEVLKDWLDHADGGLRPRIALIEIRAAGDAEVKRPKGGGLLTSLLGPVETLYNVRATSQLARNDLEFELLRRVWAADGVDARRFTFVLSGAFPLSWHLTPCERRWIEGHWPAPAADQCGGREPPVAARQHNGAMLDSLAAFLAR